MTEAGSQIATAKEIGELPAILPNWKITGTQPACISSSALAKGYLQLDSKGSLIIEHFEGNFITDDHLTLSEQETVLKVERAGSLIKILGELVSVDEINRSFAKNVKNEYSQGWALLPIKHPRRGHHLWIVIEGSPDEQGLYWSELVGAWNQQVGGLKTIEGVRFVDEFPRSDLGKILKNKLIECLFS